MERYDFTKLGGFPFTQGVLKDMQETYITVLQQFFSNFGDGPYIISGMQQSGGSITDGWFYYNGDMIPFTGGVIPTPAGSDVVLVEITYNTGTLTFNDSSTPVVKVGPTAALITAASVTDATHFPLDSLQYFGREANWNIITIPGGAPNFISGTVSYKKDFTNNLLYIRGLLTVGSAGFAGGPGYLTLATLAAAYRPNTKSHWFSPHDCTGGFIYDDQTPQAPIKGVDCYLDTTGAINVMGVAIGGAGGSYGVEFNTVIPLD